MKPLPATTSRAAKPCLSPVAVWQMLLTRLLEQHYGLTVNDTPFSDENVIKEHIDAGITLPTASLIGLLNRKLTGWVNYYRHVVAKAIFSKIDSVIFWALYRMIRRKHSRKSKGWLYRKYYGSRGFRRWIFHAIWRTKNGEVRDISLKL